MLLPVADNSSRIRRGGPGGRLRAELQALLRGIRSLRTDGDNEGSEIEQR